MKARCKMKNEDCRLGVKYIILFTEKPFKECTIKFYLLTYLMKTERKLHSRRGLKQNPANMPTLTSHLLLQIPSFNVYET